MKTSYFADRLTKTLKSLFAIQQGRAGRLADLCRFLTLTAIILFSALAASAQTAAPCPPEYTVCLTKEQANENAAKLRERLAMIDVQIPELRAQVLTEKQNRLTAQETAQKNEIDLRDALIKTQIALGEKTGELIGAEAAVVRLTAENQFLITKVRKKCLPFAVCLGGQ